MLILFCRTTAYIPIKPAIYGGSGFYYLHDPIILENIPIVKNKIGIFSLLLMLRHYQDVNYSDLRKITDAL